MYKRQNTNIEAVFDLILKTAVNQKMTQKELPQNILILSDMEFDRCVNCGFEANQRVLPTEKLFQTFAKRYQKEGYQLPRLIFWNICSRTGTIPIQENSLGVVLVSGFSLNLIKMVLSNQIDPLAALLEQLQTERYAAVEAAVRDLI